MGNCASSDKVHEARKMSTARRRSRSNSDATSTASSTSSLDASFALPSPVGGGASTSKKSFCGSSGSSTSSNRGRKIHFGPVNVVEISATNPNQLLHYTDCESVCLDNSAIIGDYSTCASPTNMAVNNFGSVPLPHDTHCSPFSPNASTSSVLLEDIVGNGTGQQEEQEEDVTCAEVGSKFVMPMVSLIPHDGPNPSPLPHQCGDLLISDHNNDANICTADTYAEPSPTNRFSKKYEQAKNSPTVGALRR